MKEEKRVFNLPQGCTELIIREGQARKELDEIAPISLKLSGAIQSVSEFLSKRKDEIAQNQAHIIVNREDVSIKLVVNESRPYYRGEVYGKLEYHPAFVRFGINTGKVWNPTDLALFFKMNRAFFSDRTVNMSLVSTLMNFTATVNQKIERAISEKGDRGDNFTQVVNSNLPESFYIQCPIFKGLPSESIEVETFAQIDGRQVQFVLLSPGAKATLEDIRDKVVDAQLEIIRQITPDIVIIEE